MFGLFKSKKLDILEQTQKNLEATQQNAILMTSALNELIEAKRPVVQAKPVKSADEKLKAAYALNICTVSVSQIIDYNDIYFLEREYDTILNNLNLEEMPKDEALLDILKQLLDVITFFRIQEGDRALMEREYTQKMKNAIWSSVPNLTVVLATGNPVAMAVSLASQVGIGYMNYRKEKANIALEKERAEWELQRSAMEQFNGLRRELFDTAWRLADEYEFPDEYRITERQIKQFNNILLDPNDLRRYERLSYIEDKFKAYPPFWYYLGNAANGVSQSQDIDSATRNDYRARAQNLFSHFLNLTKHNLFREDQLVAECALEYVDLIDDKTKQLELIQLAIKSAGNAFDVLQLCAMAYLKIGETSAACNILRMLVNESYNEQINSQILSSIYVHTFISGQRNTKNEYETLYDRVENKNWIFPMPDNDIPKDQLQDRFISKQREILIRSYADTVKQFIEIHQRKLQLMHTVEGDVSEQFIEMIQTLCESVGELVGEQNKISFSETLRQQITNNSGTIKCMITSDEPRLKGANMITFEKLATEAFEQLATNIKGFVNSLNSMVDISITETKLHGFCRKNGIYLNGSCNIASIAAYNRSLEQLIFGDDFSRKIEINNKARNLIDILKDDKFSTETLVTNSKAKLTFIKHGCADFDAYLQRNKKRIERIKNWHSSVVPSNNSIVAILNDRSISDSDLIFTTEGVVNSRISFTNAAQYKYIFPGNKGEVMIEIHPYRDKNLDMNLLWKMIDEFGSVSNSFSNKDSNELSDKIKSIIIS